MASGQIFRDSSFYAVGLGVGELASADFNHDGQADIVAVNDFAATISVLLGNGDGTFKEHADYATGADPRSVAVGDFNGDGNPDVAVSVLGPVEPLCAAPTLSVFLGRGDGTFGPRMDYTTGCDPNSVAVGDFNGDGKQDVVTADYLDSTVSVFLGNGDGTFRPRVVQPLASRPVAVVVGDFNGDRKDDVATANEVGPVVGVLLGNGDGTFQPSVSYGKGGTGGGTALVADDFNHDGRTDLAVANGQLTVFLGNGDGTFRDPLDYPAPGGGTFVTTTDLNGDGNVDLIGSGPELAVLLGNGDGTFLVAGTYSGGSGGGGAVAVDLNSDGNPDVAMAGGLLFAPSGGVVLVSLGNGDGTLQGCRMFLAAGPSPVVADFNRDGIEDAATANTLLLGNGDGTFQPAIMYQSNGALSAVAGDFDNDGKPDMAITTTIPDSNSTSLSILLGNGDGTFQPAVDYEDGVNATFLIAGDFNGDGKTDLANINNTEDIVSVFLGRGDGSFHARVTYATGRLPGSLAIADFNGDAKQDLAMVTCSTSGSCLTNALSFLFGNGDGTFQPHVDQDLGVATGALVVGDFNLDASPDLALTTGVDSGSAAVSIFLGKGHGAFEPPLQYAIGGVAFHLAARDFNGDGKQDLAVVRGDQGVLTLLVGNGDGSFQREKDYITSGLQSSAEADFNADGKTDLIVAGGIGAYFAPVLLNIANAQTFTLAVTKAGTGTGTVMIDPGLVTCMPSCSGKFGDGATVTLVAHPDTTSSFTGWSGAGCSGTGTCSLTLTSDRTVTATFDLTSDSSQPHSGGGGGMLDPLWLLLLSLLTVQAGAMRWRAARHLR